MSCLGHTKSSRIYSSTAFFIVCGGAYEGQMYWFVGAVDFVVGSLGENMAKMFILEGGFEVLEMSFEVSEGGFEVLEMGFEVSEGGFEVLEMDFEVSEGKFEVLEMSFEVLEMNFEVSEGRFGCLDGMIDKK